MGCTCKQEVQRLYIYIGREREREGGRPQEDPFRLQEGVLVSFQVCLAISERCHARIPKVLLLGCKELQLATTSQSSRAKCNTVLVCLK